MASPATYSVEIDTGLDGMYGEAIDDVTEWVTGISWRLGMDEPYQEFANPSQCYVTLDNSDGRFDVARSGAAFEGSLTPGMLVRVKMDYGGTNQQMWEGRIAVGDPLVGPKLEMPFIQVRAIDPLFDLTRLDYSPELLTDVTTSEALQAFFDNAPAAYPYDTLWFALGLSYLGESTYLFAPDDFINFEAGKSTIAYAGAIVDTGVEATTIKAGQYLREIVDQEGGGRFFWNGRDHSFTFHNRHHDLLLDTSGSTDVPETVIAARPRYGDDLMNRIVLRWGPKALGSVGSILYAADNVPFTIRGGDTRRIQCRFRDPDNPDVRVAAATVVTPELGTHVVTDNDDVVAMGYDKRANLLVLDLTNTSNSDVSVTGITVRGTPIFTYNPEEIEKLDAASMALYGKRSRSISKKFQNLADAEGFTQNLLNMFKDATLRIDMFELRVEDATEAAFARDVTVGDLVYFDDSASGHSGHAAYYVVVGESHEVDGEGFHLARYIVRRKDKLVGWRLGVVGFGELGVNTYLTF